MAQSEIFCEYAYAPLPDPSAFIRLIEKATPTTEGYPHPICIRIVTKPLMESTKYHACSYTWGESSNQQRITIVTEDGSTHMLVNQNCADVLRQIENLGTADYYWIDAICINQKSNEEKAFQVALMQDIYSQAEKVLACVGRHFDDSKWMARMLRDFDENAMWHGIDIRALIGKEEERTKETSRGYSMAEEWLWKLPDEATVRLFKALDNFTLRQYFWRIWILQENYLARRLAIFCGDTELSLPTLLFWWSTSKMLWFFQHRQDREAGKERPLLQRKLTSTEEGRSYTRSAIWNDALRFLDHGGSGLGAQFEDILFDVARESSEEKEMKKMSLRKMLDLCRLRRCTDPRDTVYGTFALATWSGAGAFMPNGQFTYSHGNETGVLRPDYTRSVFELAKEMLLHFRTIRSVTFLIRDMLRLDAFDKDVQLGISARQAQRSGPEIYTDEDVIHMAISQPQDQVQLALGGFQFSSQVNWSTVGTTNTVNITHQSGHTLALASSGAQDGDWFCPMGPSLGVVIRQIHRDSRYYTMVGKAWFPGLSDDTELQAFMFWFGVEDLIVHIATTVVLEEEEAWEEGSTEIQEALAVNVCRDIVSSFAEFPGEVCMYPASGFEEVHRDDQIAFGLLAEWHERLAERDAAMGFEQERTTAEQEQEWSKPKRKIATAEGAISSFANVCD